MSPGRDERIDPTAQESLGAAAPARLPTAKICMRCSSRYDASRVVCPSDGEPLVDDPEALVGQTLDGTYEIERLLGRGGMGAVYLARHVLLRDRVAIKTLPGASGDRVDAMRRFLREGRAARLIRHPNSVMVHELRTSAEGVTYMVMEYVDGRTLAAELRRRGRFRPEEALAVLRPIASALEQAHEAGVIHRDLKPDNIMIGEEDGRRIVKLLDLGLAKMLDGAGGSAAPSNLTVPGTVMGTAYYMSPEQWGELPRDGGPEIDRRTDVYSLGVIFYELVAGRRPFDAPTALELRRMHVTAEPPWLHTEAPEVGLAASRAVRRAMAKDRGERQPSVQELLDEIAAGCDLSETADYGHEEPAPRRDAPVVALDAPTVAIRRVGAKRRATLLLGAASAGVALAAAAVSMRPVETVAPASPPRAVVAPAPVVAPAIAFRLTVQRRSDRKELDAPEGIVFGAGDGIRITVTASRDGFLAIVNEGPERDPLTGRGPFTVLFPSPTVNGGSARIAAGDSLGLPERTWLRLDDAVGTERVWFLWSEEEPVELAGLAELVTPERLGRVESPKLRATLGARTAEGTDRPVAEIDREAKVTTLSSSGRRFAYPLLLEHH